MSGHESHHPVVEVGEPAGIKPISLLRRAATGLLYGVAVLGALIVGKFATGVLFGIMGGFAAAEFYAIERREARLPNEVFGVAAAALMPIVAAVWGLGGLSSTVTGLIAASLVWHVLIPRVRTADTATTVFGTVYTGFLLAYLVLIREFVNGGLYLSIVMVASVWVADMSAFFVGSLIGRHKMAPRISPKKSWEGFLAGAIGCTAVWVAAPHLPSFNVLGVSFVTPELPLDLAFAVGCAVAVSSLIGDLAESRMKREAGVKDSGVALPGHGGFLDRLDSLILACLVAYWVLWWGGVR